MGFARMPIRWIVGFIATATVGYVYLVPVGLVRAPHTCITETRTKLLNVSGFDFEISETDCSTLGEDASISVFASKSGQPGKTLLFKYGPAGTDPVAVITSVDEHTVQISVKRISDVVFQKDSWEGLSVNYNIGFIDYPGSG
jgi:hypothetical protein